MKKRSQKLFWIIAILFLFIIIGTAVFFHLQNRTHFNSSDVSGNTAGNYYNTGLFCEHNGMVYFSNPHDDYTLYEMTPEGTNARQLSTDKVSFLNADDHYIYYVRDNLKKSNSNTPFSFLPSDSNSLCRIGQDGKQITILDKESSLYATLSGNYIYYIHYDDKTASTLYKVKIDGTEKEKLNSFPLLLSPASNGKLCYNGLDQNHNIYLWNSAGDNSSLLYEGNCWNPIADGSYIYFMDCENDYHLTRIDKNGQNKTDISNCRVDCYNIYGNYAYYQKNNIDQDIHELCRKALDDSSEEEIIATGTYCDINITSNYVYFRNFQNQDAFFKTPTTGAIDVKPFSFESKN